MEKNTFFLNNVAGFDWLRDCSLLPVVYMEEGWISNCREQRMVEDCALQLKHILRYHCKGHKFLHMRCSVSFGDPIPCARAKNLQEKKAFFKP